MNPNHNPNPRPHNPNLHPNPHPHPHPHPHPNKPHACFFATRDIEAGETLTYLRDQAAVAAVSGRAGAVGQGGVGYKPIKCLCGHPGCRGFA